MRCVNSRNFGILDEVMQDHFVWLDNMTKADNSILKQARWQKRINCGVSPSIAEYLRNFYFRYDDYDQCILTQVRTNATIIHIINFVNF